MKNITYLLLLIITISVGITSCETEAAPRTLYEKIERAELKKDIRKDSLFLGLHFGMKKVDFFNHCEALNQDSILYQGNGGKPEFFIKDDLKYKSRMNFYPEYQNDLIWEMPVRFEYDGWAPWNKDYNATQLRKRVATMMMDWYGGNDFFEVPHPIDTIALVKIDGNRRIVLQRESAGAFVEAIYTDLTVEKELMKKAAAKREEEAEK